MKQISIYIILVIGAIIGTLGVAHASGQGSKGSDLGGAHTQHPPHDHHQTDHIKKLDESMRRNREDEEKSI